MTATGCLGRILRSRTIAMFGAHVSWCWENPNLSYGCVNSSAVLTRTSGHRYPVLRPDETVSWYQAVTKKNSRTWYDACIARWHDYEEVHHAIDHCDLHVSWPPVSILKGWGEHMCQLVGTPLPVNPGESSGGTQGSFPSVAVDPCRAVEMRLDRGRSRPTLPHLASQSTRPLPSAFSRTRRALRASPRRASSATSSGRTSM